MGSPRRKRALVCLAILLCILAISMRGTRTFASSLASKLTHLHAAQPGSLPHGGPIPYILDLSKHKDRPAVVQANKPSQRAATKPIGGRSRTSKPAANPLTK